MNKEIFLSGLNELNISITEEQLTKFIDYSSLLKEWNEKINLTAIVDDDGIAVKHFLDSLLPLGKNLIKNGESFCDIGTGAGFPGVPLKIMLSGSDCLLLDSLLKRIKFLDEVKNQTALKKIKLVHGRAEEISRKAEYREKFDVCVSRAVADMTILSEICLPYVKTGGRFLAFKSDSADGEILNSRTIIGELGGKLCDIVSVKLPHSDITRKIAVVEKIKPTPKAFPRSAKKIFKKSAK